MKFYSKLAIYICVLCVYGTCGFPIEDSVDIASKSTSLVIKLNDEVANSTIENSGSAYRKNYLTVYDIPPCNENDGHLGACLKEVFNSLVPRLKNGDQELNVLPFEPFILNRTTFRYANGAISVHLTMQNAKVYGFSNTTLKMIDLQLNNDKMKIRTLALIPAMMIIGNYKANMNVNNNIRLRPNGAFNLTLVGVSIAAQADGKLYNADGHQFMQLTSFDADPKIREFKVHIDGLFNEPELNELTSNIASQYWRQMYQLALPETRRYWSTMLLCVLNDALSQIPFDNFVQRK